MRTHEPADYDCPFCRIQQGGHDGHNQPEDVIGVTDLAYARISPKWWPGNPGAALVIPRGRGADGVRLRGHLDAPAPLDAVGDGDGESIVLRDKAETLLRLLWHRADPDVHVSDLHARGLLSGALTP